MGRDNSQRSYQYYSYAVWLVVIIFLVELVCSNNSKIQDGLFASNKHKRQVIVTFGSTTEQKNIVNKISAEYGTYSREERIYALHGALSGYSKQCQGKAKEYLDDNSYSYRAMWATNSLVIKNADKECVHKLAQLDDVHFIAEDKETPLIDPILFETKIQATKVVTNPFRLGMSWGLSTMRVKEAWNYAKYGYGGHDEKRGKGVVVGHIDTGVRYTHEALRDNFREYNGWADGYHVSPDKPEDLNGHGTHTIGTIVGAYNIGVAPGAEWISCRGCYQRGCRDSALLFCCQWMLCPYNTSESHGPKHYSDCAGAPHLVSNSWGGGQGDHTYERCINALHAVGIIPVWAIGNEGDDCTTASSPGDNPLVIGVCATNKDDELASFSSRGPTVDGNMKGDICAPGVEIKSSWFTSDKAYNAISGTSMATPHAAGVVALMLERCRLPYKTVADVLEETADKEDLGVNDQICGDSRSFIFPNNFYGFGRLNALRAVMKAVEICHLLDYSTYEHYANYTHFYTSSPKVPYEGGSY